MIWNEWNQSTPEAFFSTSPVSTSPHRAGKKKVKRDLESAKEYEILMLPAPSDSVTSSWNRNSTEWDRNNTNSLLTYEPRHDKTNKLAVRPAKTHISLGIRQSLRCPHEESLGP